MKIRHIGPMAQDFYATFDVGKNETTITTIDADGVALAGIKALNEKLEKENEELRKQDETLKEENHKLKEALIDLLKRVETLEGR